MNAHIMNAAEIIQTLKARGYSQTVIGESIGKSQAVISRWGKGDGSPNRAEYEALVRLNEATPQESEPPEGRRRKEVGDSISSDAARETRRDVNSNQPQLVSVQADSGLRELAIELKADLETLFRTVGMDAVRAEVKRLWQKQLEEAISERNAYFEKHGLPLAKFRSI